ncbi:MAG: hypothetical protein OMM_11517, partial [Candidatus Magnetoglobus multicellularis str. Araruama]
MEVINYMITKNKFFIKIIKIGGIIVGALSFLSTVISLCLGFNPFIETIASPNLIDKNIMSDVTFRSIPRLTINDLGLENEGSKIYIQAFETNRNNKIFEQTASNCLHNVINIENNPKTKSHLYVLWGIELLKNKEHE